MTIDDPADQGKKIKIDFMSRKNWGGTILVRKFDGNGKLTGWSLSSTRQSADAAFNQPVKQTGVSLPLRARDKGRQA